MTPRAGSTIAAKDVAVAQALAGEDDRMDALHPVVVLHGERSDDGQRMGARSADRLNIGGNACTAARVDAGEHQHARPLHG